MRLLTFSINGDAPPRVGLAVTVGGGTYVIDARRTYAAYLRTAMSAALAQRIARALMPTDMRLVLEAGSDAARALRATDAYAHEQVGTLHEVSSWKRCGLLFDSEEITFHPPVPRPGKILAVGSNYPVPGADGAAGASPSTDRPPPLIFSKAASSLIGHRATFRVQPGTDDLDCEAELAVVIGRHAHRIAAADANDVIAGYTILNDLTRRGLVEAERARGSVCFAKNFPGSAPCGPYVVTADEFDPGEATIETWVGRDRTQHGRAADMVTGVAELVALCSQAGLEPGDIISTGSPKPAPGTSRRYLGAGDGVTIRISGIGELHTHLKAGG
jgi:2-keto-4-pentenoate hydratase/2-oxohepta-3-ene-1,7-dioic acid hydratase in catechol pathway